jgi:hypothetical protein
MYKIQWEEQKKVREGESLSVCRTSVKSCELVSERR